MIKLHAGCKINLFLKITGKREDGYHNLESLFIPLKNPHDTLLIEPAANTGLDLECRELSLTPEENILYKTFNLFCEASGFRPAIKLHLKKNIPPGSGLGGGSSDAASFLNFLNSCLPEPLAENKLSAIAAKTGADVPFFLHNRQAFVSGIGDDLQILSAPLKNLFITIVWPDINISTSWAFKTYDEYKSANKPRNDKEKRLTKHYTQDTEFFHLNTLSGFNIQNFYNDLERPVFARYPLLKSIKAAFYKMGAVFSGMSGSGSTIFGVFYEWEPAEKALAYWKKFYSASYMAHI